MVICFSLNTACVISSHSAGRSFGWAGSALSDLLSRNISAASLARVGTHAPTARRAELLDGRSHSPGRAERKQCRQRQTCCARAPPDKDEHTEESCKQSRRHNSGVSCVPLRHLNGDASMHHGRLDTEAWCPCALPAPAAAAPSASLGLVCK